MASSLPYTFRQRSSIAWRLKAMTVAISAFFLLDFVALLFSSQVFFRALNDLHVTNQLSTRLVQARDAMSVLQKMLDQLQIPSASKEISPVLTGTSKEAQQLIQRSLDLAQEYPEALKRLAPAQKQFHYVANILQKPVEQVSSSDLLVLSQFIVEIIETLTKTQLYVNEQADQLFQDVNRHRSRPLTVGLILAIIFLVGVLVIGFTTSRRITTSIQKLIDHTRTVASGNLDPPHLRVEADEIGYLAHAFEQMTQELRGTMVSRNALENANRELEAFSYSVSHDLRAPLRAIDGFSHALMEDSGDALGSESVNHLHRIRAASQKMGHLIDDLLKLSRLSRAEMHVSKVDLTAMAHSIVEELRETDPDRKVNVSIEDDLTVLADPALLQVAVKNLLENAWKYTSKRADARIEFGRQYKNKTPVFFIRDNGAGFSMEYAGKLFGAFQRLHSPNEFPGTGIGLATVLRIFRRHGGDAWAEAEVNKGATFYFSLPSISSDVRPGDTSVSL